MSGRVAGVVRRLVVGVAAVVAAGSLCVPSAVAVDSPGYWYVDDAGVRDAWAQGVTGEGVKVAVVDDQAVSDYPGFAGVDASYRAEILHGDSCEADDSYLTTTKVEGRRTMRRDDSSRKAGDGGIYTTHGTNMMAFIVGNGQGYDGNLGVLGSAPKASVTFYAKGFSLPGLMEGGIPALCVDKSGDWLSNSYSIQQAAKAGARIVSMSMSGDSARVPYLLYAVRHGVVMVTGRGNDPVKGVKDLVGKPETINEFPGQVVVNAVDRNGNIDESMDVMDGNVVILSPGVDVLRYRDTGDKAPEVGAGGTSAATAILAGYLTLVMSKWPEATGNQVLQSLVRNTKGNDSGEARLDPEHKRGFGEVDLRKLLAVDPSQYPDINPILQWQVETSEKHEETRGMYTDHSDWPEHSTGETDPFDGDDGERTIRVPKEAELVGRELDRQLKAWKKVESCRADGGSDCMRYSATNTADAADEMTPLPDTGSDAGSSGSRSGLPSWLWWAVGGGVLVLAVGGIVLAVVASRRRRRGRHGGDGNGQGPAAPPMPPVPPMPPMPPVAPAGVRPPVPQAYPVSPSFVSYGDGGLRTEGPSMGSPVVPGSPQAGPASVANLPYVSRSAYPPVDASSVVSPDHAQQSVENRQRQPVHQQR